MRVPLEGWIDRSDKRIYVWFDAVVGYLSASIEWARRSGDPEAWRQWWQTPDADAYYFMGKDNIVFHSEIWPAQLLGYNGEGDKGGTPGRSAGSTCPPRSCSSEFLTMEGRKFSSSPQRRHLRARLPRPLRRRRAALLHRGRRPGEPGHRLHLGGVPAAATTTSSSPAGATWSTGRVSMAAKNVGAVPTPGELTDADRALLATTSGAFAPIGDMLSRNRQKAAINEAMRVVGEANKYLSDQAPWKLKEDPARRDTVLHTALQAIKDCNALLTPFLPHSSQQVHELLGGTGVWSVAPEVHEVTDLDDGSPYPIITGPYDQGQAVWASTPLAAVRHAAGRADAGLHQARPVDRRRGDPAARGRRMSRSASARANRRGEPPPSPEPLPAPALDSHTHLDIVLGERPAGRRARGVGVRTTTSTPRSPPRPRST